MQVYGIALIEAIAATLRIADGVTPDKPRRVRPTRRPA
jgi:hypothetical protein